MLEETLPALDALREKGLVRAIGVTGYPLDVQREIIEKSRVKITTSLAYAHLNLHDTSLLSSDFAEVCKERGVQLLAAAPLSMGLLTHSSPPSWHPAGCHLKEKCSRAAKYCESKGVNLSRIATIYALSFAEIPCTLIGMKNQEELENALNAAKSIAEPFNFDNQDLKRLPLNRQEAAVLTTLLSDERFFGGGQEFWDGKEEARKWWRANKLENV